MAFLQSSSTFIMAKNLIVTPEIRAIFEEKCKKKKTLSTSWSKKRVNSSSNVKTVSLMRCCNKSATSR